MKKNEVAIIEAAIRVLTRYGVRRTTMQDIAQEAGLVRQTLYNVYKNKNDILRAIVLHVASETIATIETRMENTSSLEERFDILVNLYGVQMFDMAHATPDAHEAIREVEKIAQKQKAMANEQYRQLIENMLAPCQASIEANGAGLAPFADFVQRSIHGFIHDATDRDHMISLLAVLKATVMTVAGFPPGQIKSSGV